MLRLLPMVLLLAACGEAQITTPKDNRTIHYALLEAPSPDSVNEIVATLRRRLQAVGPDTIVVRREGNQIRLETQATASELGQMISRFLQPGIVTINLVDDTADATLFEVGVARGGRVSLPDRSTNGMPLVVFAKPIVERADIAAADASFDTYGGPSVAFRLRSDAAKRFAVTTGIHIGDRMAIVVDGQIISAPRISSSITEGSVQITGVFTTGEAQQLAATLSSEPLPPITVVKRGAEKAEAS